VSDRAVSDEKAAPPTTRREEATEAAAGATAAAPVTGSPQSERAEPAEPGVKVVDRRWWAREGTAGDREGPASSLKPTYVEELEQRLAEKDRALQEYAAKYREASAEFDAARARWRREIAKDIERGRRTMLVELLEVVDNLDRALEAAAQGTRDIDTLLQGVGLVRQQFLATLEGFGVKRLDTVGEAFDPHRHEAISTVPTTTPEEDNRVVGVVKRGYMIGDEVLRPAMVAVAKLVLSTPGSA
jgi:molecular chaperone GrpE